MAIVVDATFENGLLRPDGPLPLKDRQRVRITVQTEPSWAQRTRGIMGFSGSAELADRFAFDPELDPLEDA